MWNIHRDFNTTGKYNGTGVQLSYQHNFRRPDHNIVTSYQYYYTDQNDITNYFLEYLSGEGSEYPFSSDRNNIKRNYHIVQLDYSNRLDNHHLLEAGGKMFLNDNSNLVRPFFGPSEEEAVEADGMVVKMDRMMNVYALYGSQIP